MKQHKKEKRKQRRAEQAENPEKAGNKPKASILHLTRFNNL